MKFPPLNYSWSEPRLVLNRARACKLRKRGECIKAVNPEDGNGWVWYPDRNRQLYRMIWGGSKPLSKAFIEGWLQGVRQAYNPDVHGAKFGYVIDVLEFALAAKTEAELIDKYLLCFADNFLIWKAEDQKGVWEGVLYEVLGHGWRSVKCKAAGGAE